MVDAPDAVPGPLRERALAYLAGPRETVAPRHAATVVLLRDTREGLEVYLLRRTGSMAFAAGMHVFPGGSVDRRDGDASPAWAGPGPDEWARHLGCDEPLARALVCAAVRETFEESGVLLAGPSTGSVVGDTTSEEWERDRLALLDRSSSMSGLLERRGLVLRSDLLAPFAHWITPEFEPRRFDTRFFAARVPPEAVCEPHDAEMTDSVWLPLGEAVERFRQGQLRLLPPTVHTLQRLDGYASWDALRAALEAAPVPAITPRMERRPEGVAIVVPE